MPGGRRSRARETPHRGQAQPEPDPRRRLRRSGRIDHTEKLEIYQGLASAQAYLIVHQRQRRVERHWRAAEGAWQVQVITSGSVPIPCIGVDLALDAIYAGVS